MLGFSLRHFEVHKVLTHRFFHVIHPERSMLDHPGVHTATALRKSEKTLLICATPRFRSRSLSSVPSCSPVLRCFPLSGLRNTCNEKPSGSVPKNAPDQWPWYLWRNWTDQNRRTLLYHPLDHLAYDRQTIWYLTGQLSPAITNNTETPLLLRITKRPKNVGKNNHLNISKVLLTIHSVIDDKVLTRTQFYLKSHLCLAKSDLNLDNWHILTPDLNPDLPSLDLFEGQSARLGQAELSEHDLNNVHGGENPEHSVDAQHSLQPHVGVHETGTQRAVGQARTGINDSLDDREYVLRPLKYKRNV